ncbi:DMT family transporter [Pseudonocardia sp. RS010]|uniref:DMT family transporter n=1 Tax=Pseudonocardia sp. RS010 TaxID=3385979 RepID=UPI0039A08360
MLLPIGLALVAAALNATASVLQRRAARDEPDEREFSFRMLLDLARRPDWIGGITAILAGFLAQATALTLGGVAIVQPLLVAELPFTILLAALVFHLRPGGREWWSIGALAVGLAAVVFALSPHGGHAAQVSGPAWALASGATGAVFGVALVVGLRTSGPPRAAAFGIATGVLFGYIAVLVTAVGAEYGQGLHAVLTAWQTWAVVVLGPASFFLLQNTLQAGNLVASQPGMTLANPLVATTWGVVVFQEQVRGGGWLALAGAGGVLLVAGTLALARSPLLSDEDDSGSDDGAADPPEDRDGGPVSGRAGQPESRVHRS